MIFLQDVARRLLSQYAGSTEKSIRKGKITFTWINKIHKINLNKTHLPKDISVLQNAHMFNKLDVLE